MTLSVSIDGSDVHSDGTCQYTLYRIAVEHDGQKWNVHKRYSQFLKLERDLVDTCGDIGFSIFHLSWLKNGTTVSVVKERVRLLAQFLQHLIAHYKERVELSDFFRIPRIGMDDSIVSSDDDEFKSPPPTPPHFEDMVSWVKQLVECRNHKQVIQEISKLGRDELVDFLSWLLERTRDRRSTNEFHQIPTVPAIDILQLVRKLVSIESNFEGQAVVVSIIRDLDWTGLCDFVRFPTIASTKNTVFHILKSVDAEKIFLKDDYLLGQYIAWLRVSEQYAISNDDQLIGNDSDGLFVLGPNSPSARSVGPFSPSARSQIASSLANEAKEWVMFSVSTGRDFSIAGALASDDWILVNPPDPIDIVGNFNLKYKKTISSVGGGEFEVRINWNLPDCVDMVSLAALIYEPSNGDDYFGFLRRSTKTSTVCEFFDNRRKQNGTAVASMVKSISRGFSNDRIIIACASDPRGTGNSDPAVRQIRYLHFAGCEIDLTNGTVTGSALLSSESIFLVANDLLGEVGYLWKAWSNLSCQLINMGDTPLEVLTNWLENK
jgi:hypothetical protein